MPTPSERVGVKEYPDCGDPDTSLKCVTWATRVSLIPHSTLEWHASYSRDLDADAVRGLVAQLQEWLNKLP